MSERSERPLSIWEIICDNGLAHKRNHTKYHIDFSDLLFCAAVDFSYWKHKDEEEDDFAEVRVVNDFLKDDHYGTYIVEATPTCLWVEREWV